MKSIGNFELAYRIAVRTGLPGADGLVNEKYNQCMNSGQYNEAAKIAANSPRVNL